jgi:hypothetical protein
MPVSACMRVPRSAFASIGRTKLSAEFAVAPITIVFRRRSSTLRAGAVCQTQVTCGSCSVVPIQLKRPRSNFTALPSVERSFSRGSNGTLLVGIPITLPSRLATL